VFGPEDGFMPPALYDAVVYIPTALALNLATTVAVVLYDKHMKEFGREQTHRPNGRSNRADAGRI
jgi:tRNA(Leu) C34 or U34 (ribose-2'-O)-methylase TrmL